MTYRVLPRCVPRNKTHVSSGEKNSSGKKKSIKKLDNLVYFREKNLPTFETS
jgi:hypothetical protein